MKLSDRVIKDISKRMPSPGQKRGRTSASIQHLDPSLLGDVDAWDLRQQGDWYFFTARMPGLQGTRKFRRPAKVENRTARLSIVADTPGPLIGFVGLGGSVRSRGFSGRPKFPQHVASPEVDGHITNLTPQSSLYQVRKFTRDGALADKYIHLRYENYQSLPMCFVATDQDASESIADLKDGQAYTNFHVNLQSLQASAAELGKEAELASIGLEFVLEDTNSAPKDWVHGMKSLIEKICADVKRLGFTPPPILSLYNCGGTEIAERPLLQAQSELAWMHRSPRFHYVAPAYMFKHDPKGEVVSESLGDLTIMEHAALSTLRDGKPWACPKMTSAEREADGSVVRVKFQSLGPLMLDKRNPFNLGRTNGFGFSFEGPGGKIGIQNIYIDETSPEEVIIETRRPITSNGVKLQYAFGQDQKRDAIDYPKICGALRDNWMLKVEEGRRLHRWALPGIVEVS